MGDIPPESAAVIQKLMIGKCNFASKLVILSTQPLQSMEWAPQPTTVEANALANAVLDGVDCIMLSGETSTGDYPVDAVIAARRICQKAEIDRSAYAPPKCV